MAFDDLIGGEFLFYGIDNHLFKLDDTTWEAMEDPSDGYRSYMESVIATDGNGIFFREPLAIVVLAIDTDKDPYGDEPNQGYKLIDEDNHTWLSFGTEYLDSYYPCFYFNYNPKPPLPPKPKAKPIEHSFDPFDRLFNPREE